MDKVAVAILLSAKSSSDALKRLYVERKFDDKSISMQTLCDAAGISSTGYLSDVLSGRRKLHLKYRRGITKAFKLGGAAARCLQTLLALDHEKDDARRAKLERRLTLLRKALRIERPPMAPELAELFLAVEVFCAFGLYQNRPTGDDLIGYFGPDRTKDIEAALQLLERLGMVRLEASGRYALLSEQVLFGNRPGSLTAVDFLKLALNDAAANVERWFPAKDQSHFASIIISVNYADYMTKLKKLKTDLLVTQADLESGAADRLVRFNIQVYPIAPAGPVAPVARRARRQS